MPLPARAGQARAQAAENRVKAFELYKAGATCQAIGRALGVGTTTAYRYITTTLQRLATEEKALAEPYRRLHLARLQDMVFACWPAAKRGDPQAILSMLRIMEREAKLLGLDAPTKIDIEGRLRRMAEREGLDPDEVVREAHQVIKESRELM